MQQLGTAKKSTNSLLGNSPPPFKGEKPSALGIQHEIESKNSFTATPSVVEGIGGGITSEVNTSINKLKDDLSAPLKFSENARGLSQKIDVASEYGADLKEEAI